MQILQSQEISHRDQFPMLCFWRKLWRVAEVGVDRGQYARTFLSQFDRYATIYLGVDNYKPYEDMQFDRSADQFAASRVFSEFKSAKLAIADSLEITYEIANLRGSNQLYGDPLDFVYIDASHERGMVMSDLTAWWPLISEKGILAGHDWSMESDNHPSVQEAVKDFAERNDLTIYHTDPAIDDPTSWFIYKNGMPGNDWVRL